MVNKHEKNKTFTKRFIFKICLNLGGFVLGDFVLRVFVLGVFVLGCFVLGGFVWGVLSWGVLSWGFCQVLVRYKGLILAKKMEDTPDNLSRKVPFFKKCLNLMYIFKIFKHKRALFLDKPT